MKYMPAVIISLLVAVTAAASSLPTVSFDQYELTVGSAPGEFAYGEFERVAIGTHVSLPAKEYYLDLSGYGDKSRIDFVVSSRSRLGSVDADFVFSDIPTADNPDQIRAALAARRNERLGREPIHVTSYVHSNGVKLARLVVFPVTVEDDGQCFFNEQVSIVVNSEPIEPELLVDNLAALNLPETKITEASLSVSEADAAYLIVTSADLLEAVEPLSEYRNVTGIVTEVALIDDILASCSGRDDAEKLRVYLQQFYASGGKYVLLAGDETRLPIRYAYPYSVSSTPPLNQLQICDLYFADLTGDWNTDNDDTWGERYIDQVDIIPEIMVGRLPFNTCEEVSNYVAKLIAYETNPGDGQPDYLRRAFFFSSDQMRDYDQHAGIAEVYPDNFVIDTVNGIELSSGNDANPYNQTGDQVESILSGGFGIVNIIAHGTNSSFGVRTAGYNEWPKSYFSTSTSSTSDGLISHLEANGKTSLYYSLACDNGGFDMDQPPFNQTAPNLVQTTLGLDKAGAVAFIANSRWGWVSSSYYFQRAFFDSLSAHPDLPAVSALYAAKASFPYYTDQIYGINYFGDPALRVHLETPNLLTTSTSYDKGQVVVTVTSDSDGIVGCDVILSKDGSILERATTNGQGDCTLLYDFTYDDDYTLCALADGYAVGYTIFTPTLSTDIDDPQSGLPAHFALYQNYPNPFNPSTVIGFELARSSNVRLTVTNILGQEVKTLVNEVLSGGVHEVVWDGAEEGGRGVASGIYFYRIDAGDFQDVRKMLLVR